jgi:non-specific serine/threonine protein kinase
VGGRAFEVIEVLAEAAGELITKDELMNRIWPGAIVMENTLQVHAAALRKALGPYRNLLKTESRRGYRLLGDWKCGATTRQGLPTVCSGYGSTANRR